MTRVYEDMDDLVDKLEFIPGFDSKDKLRMKVYLDGKKIACHDGGNQKIRLKVRMKVEENAAVRLTFDVRKGLLTVEPGRRGERKYTIPATSGTDIYMNTPDFEYKSWKGTIPRGTYKVAIDELSNPGKLKDKLRNYLGDWGDWRVPLYPITVVKTTRENFFLHGGSKPGSAGCIDIGGGLTGNKTTNRVLEDLLADSDEQAVLIVK